MYKKDCLKIEEQRKNKYKIHNLHINLLVPFPKLVVLGSLTITIFKCHLSSTAYTHVMLFY